MSRRKITDNFAFHYYNVTLFDGGGGFRSTGGPASFHKNNSIATCAARAYIHAALQKGYIANYLSYRANVRVYHSADTNEYIPTRINTFVARRCRLIIKV